VNDEREMARRAMQTDFENISYLSVKRRFGEKSGELLRAWTKVLKFTGKTTPVSAL